MRLSHALRFSPALLLVLAACHGKGEKLRAEHGWVRLAAVPGRPAAAYLVIHGGPEPVRLLAVESEDAGSSELHQSMATQGGMMSMQRLDGIDLAAGGELKFAPGGYHVMLFGMNPAIKPGKRTRLTVRFAKGPSIDIDAKVIGAGEDAPY
jgi:copper(I)-binding protein